MALLKRIGAVTPKPVIPPPVKITGSKAPQVTVLSVGPPPDAHLYKCVSISKVPDTDGEDVVMDTETTGTDYMEDKPFMLGIQVGRRQFACRWNEQVTAWLCDRLPRMKNSIWHNAKFDLHMLIQGGVPMDVIRRSSIYCTMIGAAVINEHEPSYSLDRLGWKYLQKGKSSQLLYDRLAAMFGGPATKAQMRNLHRAPDWMVNEYLFGDLDVTADLYAWQQDEIKRQELERILTLERKVTPALAEIERRGIAVHVAAVAQAETRFKNLIRDLETDIIKHVGFVPNTLSQPQMIKAFQKLGLSIPTLPDGRISFAKDLMSQVEHPIAQLIQNHKSARKMQDTFIAGVKEGGYIRRTGKIHTNFNQMRGENEFGTKTGRFSSSNPNMQQIPKRDSAAAAIIRALYIPDHKDKAWICGDWSQFEFRIFGHYAKDEGVIATYKENPDADFHQAVADLTGLKRNPYAKQINLGMVFGMGEGKMAKQIGLPYEVQMGKGKKETLIPGPEAREIFNTYHARIPGVKPFLKQAENIAKNRGYVKTIRGRHIRFPDGFFYKAGGLVFQGSAADLMKEKTVALNDAFRGIGAELLLMVHDEFNTQCPRELADEVVKLKQQIMEDIPDLRLPIRAEVKAGNSWWEGCQ